MCVIPVQMVIEKSRERVPIWKSFSSRDAAIPALFQRIIRLVHERELNIVEKTLLVQFLINSFEGFEHTLVRQVRLIPPPLFPMTSLCCFRMRACQ